MLPDPLRLVARVHALGVAIRAEGSELVLAPAGVVPPDLKAELRAAKAALLTALRDDVAAPNPLAALRAVFRRQFALAVDAVDGRAIPSTMVSSLRQRRAQLTDESGPLWADALFADELRRFGAETGRCGVCGGLGHPQEHA
jgi:hypothetical protein